MTDGGSSSLSGAAVIWMPIGRDASLASAALQKAGISSLTSRTVEEVVASIRDENSAALLLAEEALSSDTIEQLKEALADQPPWSDLPVILLTGGGNSTERSLQKLRRMQTLGRSVLLERPLRSVTLVAAVQSALAARGRQYEIRDYIRRLEQAHQHLAHANADLQQFAFAASHDLREPLRMVNIFTQLLVDRHIDRSDVKARELADFIRSGVDRLDALLRDLLSYSRVIHDEQTRPNGHLDLALPISDAGTALVLEIAEAHAELVLGSMPVIFGNRTQLSFVFQNLIGNAIKYAKPDVPPVIRISASEIHREHIIEVRDNGVGFDQKYAERIFELFQRLQTGGPPGTGLGLAISRRIVEQHGGRLWAESVPNVGSSFFLAFPSPTDAEGRGNVKS